MNCLTARKILLAEDDYNGNSEHIQAKQHAADCHDCQLFFAQEDQLRTTVRTKLSAEPVPPHLREKILSIIAREHRKRDVGTSEFFRRVPQKRTVLIAAAIAAVVLIYYLSPTWQKSDGGRVDSAVNTLIQDHLASKLKEHPLDLITSDKAQLERWFAARVDFNVTIPRFQNTELIGGHLCLVGGKRAVSLSFQKEGVPLTLYMIDRSVIDLARLKLLASIDDKPIFHHDDKGCNVILWQEKGLVYGMVSDLSETDMVNLIHASQSI